MKALICSDFQIGSGTAYGTAEQPRLADQRDMLAKIVALTYEAQPDMILFCGDAFQHRRPTVDELALFKRYFLDEMYCDTAYLLVGNHDWRGHDRLSTLDLFGEDGVWVVDKPYRTSAVRGGAGIAFMPWAPPGSSSIEARADELHAKAKSLFASVADAPVPILVTHYALSEMATPTGLPTERMREPILDVHELAEQGWRYIFAGHVHVPKLLDLGTVRVVSVGSPWVNDFGEADVAHGVWLLNTETDAITHVPLTDRPFVTLDVERDLLGNPRVDFPPNLEGAVVRVRGTVRQDEIDYMRFDDFRANLDALGVHKVHEVRLDVERPPRARADVEASDEPLAQLDAYIDANLDGDPGMRQIALRSLTTTLLQED